MMIRKSILILGLVLWGAKASYAQQYGGMWLPNELNEKEMKAMGMKIGQRDIFNPKEPSIKDAIAHFGGGCTSEVISPKGLLLTNHHCGYGQIQSHSTLEHDYLREGFWAKDYNAELPNPGLTATFIVDIKDVTSLVEAALAVKTSEAALAKLKEKAIKKIENEWEREPWQEVEIKPFYKGNKYYLFVKEVFKDIRLVGAPPSSIGKFGSDTDNWVWPRHTGDFSIFRIYADKNNRPAEYSPDNIPYKPKYFLPINIKGVEENDFTFVFGFPGRTDEYLPASSIENIVKVLNPIKIKVREEALKIMDNYMKADAKTKIQYASIYASIANYWKKWIGESQGIEKYKAVDAKKNYENILERKIKEHCKKEKSKRCVQYPSLIKELENLNQESLPYELASDLFSETIYRNSQLLRMALMANTILTKQENNTLDTIYLKDALSKIQGMYRNFNPILEEELALKMWQIYKQKVPEGVLPENVEISKEDLQNSVLTHQLLFQPKKLQNASIFLSLIKQDKLIKKIGKITNAYYVYVAPNAALQTRKNEKMKAYMKAQMDFMKGERRFFPDANATLRVTYGKVKEYNPRDAIKYLPKTYLKGVMEKYVPEDYEFDVSEKLINLYKNKDYGIYAEGKNMPVNFIATNHTTGGNSGSPALDAQGNLIGLNFDRVWEGTMSDLYYDAAICRNIMVDVRYILFIIDKYANAKRLINEMKILK